MAVNHSVVGSIPTATTKGYKMSKVDYDSLLDEYLRHMDSALWLNPPKSRVPIVVLEDFVGFLKNTVL